MATTFKSRPTPSHLVKSEFYIETADANISRKRRLREKLCFVSGTALQAWFSFDFRFDAATMNFLEGSDSRLRSDALEGTHIVWDFVARGTGLIIDRANGFNWKAGKFNFLRGTEFFLSAKRFLSLSLSSFVLSVCSIFCRYVCIVKSSFWFEIVSSPF